MSKAGLIRPPRRAQSRCRAPSRGPLELPRESALRSVVLDATGSDNGYPLVYEVHVSNDGENWGDPVATGRGEPLTRIHFPQVAKGRFLRVTLTEKDGWTPWAIHNLELYGEELQ